MAQWRFSALCRQELFHFGQFKRKALFGYRVWHSLLVVDRERFSPVTLTAEYGIAQSVVDLYSTQSVLCNVCLRCSYGILYGKSVELQLAVGELCNRRVCHDTLFCIEALLAYIASFDKRAYLNAKMLCEGIVTAVVCRNGHDSSCSVSRKYIVADPYRYLFSCDRVYRIRAGEDSGDVAVYHTFTLCTFLCTVEISLYSLFLSFCSKLCDKLAFRSKDHECNAEYGIGACCEYSEFNIAILYVELHLCTFAASYPVTLCLLQGIGPVYSFKAVEQSLCIGRYPKAPLLHLLLYDRIASTLRNTIYNLVVGKHCSECRAPVDHCLVEECNSPVHQCLLLCNFAHSVPLFGCYLNISGACGIHACTTLLAQNLNKSGYRLSALCLVVVVAVEHFYECPLCPVIVACIACPYLAVPVEAEANLVELLSVAVDILFCCNCRMLSCLYGILLCRKSVCVISHRVKHVISLKAFETCENIRCYIS